jgi:hypothetical protein
VSFETYVGVILLLATPVLLLVFLFQGVGYPPVKRQTQPVLFWIYTAALLGLLATSGFLFLRQHPTGRDLVLLMVCAFNLADSLRPLPPPEIAQPSRYAFAQAALPSRRWGQFYFWLIVTCAALAMVGYSFAAGTYADPR